MRIARFFILLTVLLTVSMTLCGAARAQDAEEYKPRPVFPQLFPHPTGNNGYEELMLAADLAQDCKPLTEAMDSNATLTAKRKALERPDVKRALALIHIAFVKPITSPRDPAKNTFETAFFVDLAAFRNLARLLGIAQYVALADGKMGVALDALEDGLRLARVIPAESLISALVFVAVDAIALSSMARHTTQLSLRDSERLERICEKCLRDTDSFAASLAGERDMVMRQYQDKAPTPDDLLKIINPFPDQSSSEEPDTTPEERALQARLKDHPGDAARIHQQAVVQITAFYNRMIAEANQEAWERSPFAEKPLKNPTQFERAVKAIADTIIPNFANILSKQDQGRANLHLLGTFAALQRYRWLHRHYPDSLRELHTPVLTIDPCTGAFLVYKKSGNSYDLHSAGTLGEDGKSRTPIYLPYRRPAAAP